MVEGLDDRPVTEDAQGDAAGAARAPRRRWFDALLIAGVLAMLAFPVGARLSADAQPIAPALGPVLARLPPDVAPVSLDSLPVFVTLSRDRVATIVSGGRAVQTAAVATAARRLYGARAARAFMHMVTGAATVRLPAQAAGSAAAENDLAALLIEAGAATTRPYEGSIPAGFGGAGDRRARAPAARGRGRRLRGGGQPRVPGRLSRHRSVPGPGQCSGAGSAGSLSTRSDAALGARAVPVDHGAAGGRLHIRARDVRPARAAIPRRRGSVVRRGRRRPAARLRPPDRRAVHRPGVAAPRAGRVRAGRAAAAERRKPGRPGPGAGGARPDP